MVSPRPLLAGALAVVVVATAVAADWPQWHGPGRDCLAGPDERPPARLPVEVQPLWRIPVGGGFAAPVIAGEVLVYLDEDGRHEVAHAVDAATGRERWRTPIADRFADEWGAGPRSTPCIDGDRVYAQSCNGEFRCLDLADGRVRWGVSFARDFGARFLGAGSDDGVAARRGNNGSPVVDGDAVILPVGGTNQASVVCLDKLDGRVRWRSGTDEAAYSSPLVTTLAGVRQVIHLSADALQGLDRADGRLLWRVPLRTMAKRHAASPVILGDRIVVNSHTFGMACFRVRRDGDRFLAEEAWWNRDLKVNLATPVHVDGHLYSQGAQRDYICVDAATGQRRWSQPGFGQGRRDYASTLAVGRTLVVLTEDGTLLLLAAAPEKYTELGRLQVCGSTWSHTAYSRGRLFVRDGRQLACVELAPTAP